MRSRGLPTTRRPYDAAFPACDRHDPDPVLQWPFINASSPAAFRIREFGMTLALKSRRCGEAARPTHCAMVVAKSEGHANLP